MKASEFRANAAGNLDAATTIVRTVSETFRRGEELKDERGQKKVECPPAIYKLLSDADEALSKVSDWLLSPDNFGLDK